MDATRDPKYLKSIALAVTDFRAALEEFLELHVTNKELTQGIAPAVFPLDGADLKEISRLQTKVSRASGRAMYAAPITGSYVAVQGLGKVDAIASRQSIVDPKPVVEPDHILGICDQLLGRLDAMIDRAEAEAPPTVGVESMHPLIWGAARRLWNYRHYRESVAAAAENLVLLLKTRIGRNDAAETALSQSTFSDKPAMSGQPRLR